MMKRGSLQITKEETEAIPDSTVLFAGKIYWHIITDIHFIVFVQNKVKVNHLLQRLILIVQ